MKTVATLGILLTAVFSSAASHAQLLSVERLMGDSQLTRNGIATTLNPADPVVDQDRLQVGDGARLTLKLGAHGFVDLGPGADATIERLPYASFATDLRTVLRLQKGYLRVVWNRPATAAAWPLFVRVGTQRLQLSSGEFFFESNGSAVTACAASGQMLFVDSRASAPLLDANCYRLGDGRPRSTVYRAEDWVAIRENFALRAPEMPGAAVASSDPQTQPVGTDSRHPRVQIETVPALPVTVPALPATVPAPIASSPATGWVLNVASMANSSDAERRAEQLRAAGYPARVQSAQVNGRLRHRVQLSGYANRAEANAAADTVGEKLGILDAWASRE